MNSPLEPSPRDGRSNQPETRTEPDRAIAVRRLIAFTVDWCVIATWGALLFAVVMLATGGEVPRPANPWLAQTIGFLAMTLPVTLYFAATESSARRASLGKRALGLVVHRVDGQRLTFRGALFRNAVKFAPWEFGHLVAQQAAHADTDALPAWVWAGAVIAFGGPLWWVVELLAKARTPYDRWAAACVARRAR